MNPGNNMGHSTFQGVRGLLRGWRLASIGRRRTVRCLNASPPNGSLRITLCQSVSITNKSNVPLCAWLNRGGVVNVRVIR